MGIKVKKSNKKKEEAKKRLKKKRRRGFVTFLICLAVVCALAFAARLVLFDSVKVASDAMSPDYKTGDVALVSKLSSWNGGGYNREDIVYAEFAAAGSQRMLRRVVGIPGDYIEDRNGDFYLLNEGYEKHLGACPGLVNGNIPAGAYLLLADDNTSPDSRTLGLVYKTDIKGTPCAVIWPVSSMGKR